MSIMLYNTGGPERNGFEKTTAPLFVNIENYRNVVEIMQFERKIH